MTELRTRRLGRTELMVTELGLGAMDTPHSPEAAAAIEDLLARAQASDAEVARQRANAQYAGEADPYKKPEDAAAE